MKKLIFLLTIIFSLPTTAATNLIINGGFENPGSIKNWKAFKPEDVPGWHGSDAVEIWNSNKMGLTPYEGTQHAELNSHAIGNHYADGKSPFSIFQDIPTIAGQTYQLSFAYRARRNEGESFRVNAGTSPLDRSLLSEVLNDHNNKGWSTFIQNFVATGDMTNISFISVTPNSGKYETHGNFLDDIAVSAVPLPAAAPLFASALGLFGFLQSRRRKLTFNQ